MRHLDAGGDAAVHGCRADVAIGRARRTAPRSVRATLEAAAARRSLATRPVPSSTIEMNRRSPLACARTRCGRRVRPARWRGARRCRPAAAAAAAAAGARRARRARRPRTAAAAERARARSRGSARQLGLAPERRRLVVEHGQRRAQVGDQGFQEPVARARRRVRSALDQAAARRTGRPARPGPAWRQVVGEQLPPRFGAPRLARPQARAPCGCGCAGRRR